MIPDITNLEWFVLYTRPKFENKICEGIKALQYESYLPNRTVKRKWSDRVKQISEPLFLNYVFVKTNISYKVDILQIPGVVRFVSSEGHPSVIRFEEIERIKLIEANYKNIQKESFYCQGDKAKVTCGPFKGMEGLIIRKVNDLRFFISLPLLKQAVSVEISLGDFEKIN